MENKMKKLELCKCCDEILSCYKDCDEALKFEAEDNSDNYSKEKYVAKNTICTWDALHNPGRE